MSDHPPLLRALREYHDGGSRDEAVRAVAAALDAVTPFDLIPGVGPLIEAATDLIWLPAAEAIVDGFEVAVAKAQAKRR